MPPWRVNHALHSERTLLCKTQKHLWPLIWSSDVVIISFCLTLLRARGAASGVLGDVDSLAVSDVELKEELLLDNSLLDGRLVANCRTDRPRVRLGQIGQLTENVLSI